MRSHMVWNIVAWIVAVAFPVAGFPEQVNIVEAVEMAQHQSRLVQQAGLRTESARASLELAEVDYRTRFGISGPGGQISVPAWNWDSWIGATLWKENRSGGSLWLGIADSFSSQIGSGGLSQSPRLSVSWGQPFLVDGQFFNRAVFASRTRLIANGIEESVLREQDTVNNVSLSAVRAYLNAFDAIAQREHSSSTIEIASGFADIDDAGVAMLLDREILEAEATVASSEIELSRALAVLGLLIGRSGMEAGALVNIDLDNVIANARSDLNSVAEREHLGSAGGPCRPGR